MRAGIDLGGTKIEGIVLDAEGAERARLRIPAPHGDYAATLDAVCGLVATLQQAAGPVTCVGIGIPGTISPATGLVKNANSTWLIGHPFDRDLERALSLPVRLANDANCFAVSEAADGAAAEAGNVFGVILGTGVGGGIALHGRPLTGVNAIAGEWGHNPLPWPGDDERPGAECYCGLTGCIETFLSGPALARDHLAVTGKTLSATEIAARAENGDKPATATLARYEHRLARALATVINTLDPDVIVLGGGLSNLERLYANVPELWGSWVFSDTVATPLVRARHGDASGVRGAAWLWTAEEAETASSNP
ncbi:MAG: ROK family protein [Rhodospirillales bacterium]